MAEVQRIDPEEAREHVRSGQALLICAYDDETKWDRMRLEGSVSLRELESEAAALPRDRELIFYCA
jgi:rhodanese-related sulfurtransferase